MSEASGDAIREARQRAGLTQGQVAAKLQITRSAVGQWERGQTSPAFYRLVQLSDLFKIDVVELVAENLKSGIKKERDRRDRLEQAFIDQDGKSKNLGVNVQAHDYVITAIVSMLVEAGVLKEDLVANRLNAYGQFMRKSGYIIGADVLETYGSVSNQNENIASESGHMPNVIATLSAKVERLEARLHALQTGFLTAVDLGLLREREPLITSLLLQAAQLGSADVEGQNALEQLAEALAVANCGK